jgi:hypothetical protein
MSGASAFAAARAKSEARDISEGDMLPYKESKLESMQGYVQGVRLQGSKVEQRASSFIILFLNLSFFNLG